MSRYMIRAYLLSSTSHSVIAWCEDLRFEALAREELRQLVAGQAK